MITSLILATMMPSAYIVNMTGRSSVLNSDNTRTNYQYGVSFLVDKPFPSRLSVYTVSTDTYEGKEYKSVYMYSNNLIMGLSDKVKDVEDITSLKFTLNDELKVQVWRRLKDLGFKPIHFNLMIDKEFDVYTYPKGAR